MPVCAQVVKQVLEACNRLPFGPQPPVMPKALYHWKKMQAAAKEGNVDPESVTMTTMTTMTATLTDAVVKSLIDQRGAGQLVKDPTALPLSSQGIVNAQVCVVGWCAVAGCHAVVEAVAD